VELAPRLGVDVAGRYGHCLYAFFVTVVGDVHRVLGEDHRVVIGEGDRLAAELQRRGGDGRRRGLVLQAVHLLRLGDVPVLAELARQVAAGGAEGKDARAGIELVERLLLHRVDAEPRGAAVGGEVHLAAFHLAHETETALAFVQLAVARAQVALDATVRKRVPPPTFHGTWPPGTATP